MNQLEHLKALRDKARIQTEQAKSVLKQQGEITESLDRLIAALENSDGDPSAIEGIAIPETISSAPAAPPKAAAPPLEPIVWEVADSPSAPPPAEPAEVEAPAAEVEDVEPEETGEAPESPAVPPVPVAVTPLPSTEPDLEKTTAIPVPAPQTPPQVIAHQEAPAETTPEPAPPAPAIPAPVSPAPAPATPAPEASSDEDLPTTNIFFDANSAYLKDSEVSKFEKILESRETRLVRVQGLEDLASSNDFKRLLASRRILAVTKKLNESGIGNDSLEVSEIDLSDDGRVLSPPSVVVTPAA